MWFLPDTPLTTRWLTSEERMLAHDRIYRDTVGHSGEASTWEGLRQAASDPRTWLFALMQNLHLSANGFKNFFPTVVETLGFSQTITLVSCTAITIPVAINTNLLLFITLGKMFCYTLLTVNKFYQSGVNMPTISDCWYFNHSVFILLWFLQWAYHPHHSFQSRRYSRLHPRHGNPEHPHPVFRHVSILCWYILCQQHHLRLGGLHLGPNKREKVSGAQYHQHLRQCQFYIHTLSVP